MEAVLALGPLEGDPCTSAASGSGKPEGVGPVLALAGAPLVATVVPVVVPRPADPFLPLSTWACRLLVRILAQESGRNTRLNCTVRTGERGRRGVGATEACRL